MAIMADDAEGPDARARILAAAFQLVATGGAAALTTRAVAAAAAVQAPTLYRLFGDKRGLLDALAEHGMATFAASKVVTSGCTDPVQELRDAWDAYVAFGLGNPAMFGIMNEVGRSGPASPAVLQGKAVLLERVRRIARAGRLRVPEQRAVALIHAAGMGTVAVLLATAQDCRDPGLSPLARDAVLAALVNDAPRRTNDGPAALAVGLGAHLDTTDALSPGEGMLMRELLARLADRLP